MTRQPAADLTPLWRQFHGAGCLKARERLIEHFAYLVIKTRERIVPNVPTAIDVEDLNSEGYIALIRTVDNYDPTRGTLFTSYAIARIRGAMLEWLRREDFVPRLVRTRNTAIERAEVALLSRGVRPTETTLAEALSLSLEAFRQFAALARIYGRVSIEQVRFWEEEDDADPLTFGAALIDPAPGPEAVALERLAEARYQDALICLGPGERRIARQYLWEDRTLKAIAAELGRSEARTHQLWSRAKAKLQVELSR